MKSKAAELAQQALAQGIDPLAAINDGYVPGISYVGEQFGAGEMFLPDLMLAAEAMKAAVAVLEPEMQRRGTQRQMLGKVVLGTVKGDIHEIGKNLVATMLSASGFEVYDLGVDVPFEKFAQKAREVERGHRRRLGAAHHDDGGAEDRHRSAGRHGPAPEGQSDGRRCAGHQELGGRNRRGRLQRRCDGGGDAGEET